MDEDAINRKFAKLRTAAGRSQHKHAEAFCLMLYRDRAGNEEWIWNSRDGVTPFIISSKQGLVAAHVEWHRDRYAPDHKPQLGDRVFVDLTIERARENRRKYVEKWWDDDMSKRYASKDEAVEQLAHADMAHGGGGQPDLMEVVLRPVEVG